MSDAPLPRLCPQVRITPFSSGAREETFLVTCPDGSSLQIDRRLRELLGLLDGRNRCSEISERLSRSWGMPVQEEDVRAWLDRHLAPRGLILEDAPRPVRPGGARKRSAAPQGVRLLPARALLPLTDRLRLLFRPAVSLPLLWASALCHLLFYHRLCSGAGRLPPLPLTPGTGLLAYGVLFLSVLFHELGHLSACRHFRCAHGEIRAGLYLIFPVLYANVTPAWSLRRKARIVVDLGGVYFQALLTIPLFWVHRFHSDALWAFLFLELDAMILFSLNPFLRFDGYWVCSDLLGVPNLRARSRRLIRDLAARAIGRTPPAAPFLDLRAPERYGLLLYAAASHLFFLAFLLVLVRFLPHRLAALPELLDRAWTAVAHGGRAGAPGGPAEIVTSLAALLLPAVLLFALARMSFRSLRGLARILGKVLRSCRRED